MNVSLENKIAKQDRVDQKFVVRGEKDSAIESRTSAWMSAATVLGMVAAGIYIGCEVKKGNLAAAKAALEGMKDVASPYSVQMFKNAAVLAVGPRIAAEAVAFVAPKVGNFTLDRVDDISRVTGSGKLSDMPGISLGKVAERAKNANNVDGKTQTNPLNAAKL